MTGPAAPAGFGSRLQAAMAAKGNLCVGIDPHPELLAQWGLNDDAAGLERFSMGVLSALGQDVAVLKPQVALFERHGSAGIAVLEQVLAAAADLGTLTLADAKRGDIGSTMAAYADAWLRDGSPLAADALTLSPYLGFESLRPALDAARDSGRGVFVLALTSNPEGAAVQHAGGPDSVAARIVAAAGRENQTAGAPGNGYGPVGLVIGATVGPALQRLQIELDRLNGPILAPGYGAQGATAADIKESFGCAYAQVLASTSRGVLRAGPDPAALRSAALRARDDLLAAAES